MAEKQTTKTWAETRAIAAATRSGRVIDANGLSSITNIPEIIARQVIAGTHNLIIDYTGRPTLQQRWS